MQRTSIFAHSNKLLTSLNTHSHNKLTSTSSCTNCQKYQKENQSLKLQLCQVTKQIQQSKPLLLQMLQNSAFNKKYQEQLLVIKKNYQNLVKKLNRYEKQHQGMQYQLDKVQRQNKKYKITIQNMKKQIKKLTEENTILSQQKQAYQNQKTVQTQNKQKSQYGSILYQINTNTTHNCLNTSYVTNSTMKDKIKFNSKEDQNYSGLDLERYLRQREHIQGQRHKKIVELRNVLSDF